MMATIIGSRTTCFDIQQNNRQMFCPFMYGGMVRLHIYIYLVQVFELYNLWTYNSIVWFVDGGLVTLLEIIMGMDIHGAKCSFISVIIPGNGWQTDRFRPASQSCATD